MKMANSPIERVEEFKYLGTTLTNENYIQEEIKSRLKLRNACYYSLQNLLSSSLLSKTLNIKIYRSIILPVVLYWCETWSLTLREVRRLRVFKNRVLRRVFGPKRDDLTGNGEYYIMRSLGIFTPYQYCAGGKIEKNEVGGACGAYGGARGVHMVLVGKPEGKRPLGRPRRRWEDNIKMDLEEVGGDGDWMELAQDRDRWRALVNTVMNFRVP